MRKFKYIGNNLKGFNPMFEKNVVYNEDFSLGVGYANVGRISEEYPDDWEEVFRKQVKPSKEEKPTTLHKDTDLGYFAGLAMQGILANEELRLKILADAQQQKISGFEAIEKEAIRSSQTLIKQLDEHRSNNPL